MASLDCLSPRGLMASFGNASGAVPPFSILTLSAKGSLYVTRPTLVSYTSVRAELVAAANELFAEYRENFAGKDRGAVELARLGRICDGLVEIRKQMLELGRVEPSDQNDRNIEIVTQQLASFENEFEAVKQVQANAPSKGVSA